MFKKILIATRNRGKLEEYRNYLNPLGYDLLDLDDEGISEDAPEEGRSFTEIAESKAHFYSQFTSHALITDDSGLEIPALDNFPGVKSNRWFKGSNQDKNNALLHRMRNISDRRAVFKTVIVYRHKKTLVRFEGQLYGTISFKPKGNMGFGYDPIFNIPSENRTLAEFLLIEKNKISHRGIAMNKLESYLRKYKQT